jgi:hypothetical protein
LISVYPVVLLLLYFVQRTRHWWRFLLLLSIPHLLLLLIMLVQGNIAQWYDQAVTFNRVYYSRYELAGDAMSIVLRSVATQLSMMVAYLDPRAVLSVTGFLFWSTLLAVAVLWQQRGALLAVLFLAVALLAQMRGDTGYHGAPWFVVAFASIGIVLLAALRGLHRWPVPCAVYVLLVAWFLRDIGGFYRHQERGPAPDQPFVQAVLAHSQPGDAIWAAPFEPYIYLAADRPPASAYWYYHPWLAESDAITRQVLDDLQTARPRVIVFRADKDIPWYFPLARPQTYGAQVYEYIRSEYRPVDFDDPVLRDVYLRR